LDLALGLYYREISQGIFACTTPASKELLVRSHELDSQDCNNWMKFLGVIKGMNRLVDVKVVTPYSRIPPSQLAAVTPDFQFVEFTVQEDNDSGEKMSYVVILYKSNGKWHYHGVYYEKPGLLPRMLR
jgi:hypothetical protein